MSLQAAVDQGQLTNKKVHTLLQLDLLGLPVGTSHDCGKKVSPPLLYDFLRQERTYAKSLCVVLHKLPCDTKYLQRQLSGGANDNSTSTVAGLESEAVQHLDNGDEESEGLEHSELLGTS